MTTTADALRKRMAEIRWTHTLDLGNGLLTPGLWAPNTPYQAMNRDLGVFKWGQDKIDWTGKIQGRGLWHAWR